MSHDDGLYGLPLEMWSHIIAALGGPHPQEDVLAQDKMDVGSLRACSLTCRTWRHLAQEHLLHFLPLKLTSATCEETVSSLKEVLPSIGPYVTALAVGISWAESRFTPQADVLAHLWVVAPMLPRVETLSLNRIELKVPTGNTAPFPAVFPILRSLYISNIPHDLHVLHAYVAACAQLCELTLMGSITGYQSFVLVVRAPKGSIIHVQPAPPVVLKTHLASVLAWITPVDVTVTAQLDELEANCTSAVDQHALASFIGNRAVHLKSLDVGFYSESERLKDNAIAESYAPFASRYLVSLNMRFPDVPYDVAEAAISQLLDHINTPALETLSIVYSVRNVASKFVAAKPTYDLARLPALKTVRLAICDAKPGLSETMKSTMTMAMPFLASAEKRGILEATIYD